nr:pyridoxal-phosphate dependent enzyme [Shimia biformata]
MTNPFRGAGLPDLTHSPRNDASAVSRLLELCPAHRPTPLTDASELAADLGVAELWIKDERGRMGLGSFKALGAAFAIARDAAKVMQGQDWATALSGRTYVTASAGNHGLSVAAGAGVFGARAIIYLSEAVPEAFADRLRTKGAEVIRDGATYEDSMAAAEKGAKAAGFTLLSDSSWPDYTEMPMAVMEGYLQMAAEVADQIEKPPTHIFLQAGVGGLAGAVAAFARATWGDMPQIIVVEPEVAPALIESIRAGRVVDTNGPVSAMGRLDCKTPSMIALGGLARDADTFVTISETEAEVAADLLARHCFDTTPSGCAGFAALLAGRPNPGEGARVLVILSEGPEDA